MQSKNDFENALIQLESYFATTYKINIYKDDPSPCVDARINEFEVIFYTVSIGLFLLSMRS